MDSNQTGEGKAGALSQVQEFALREMKHRFRFRYLWRLTQSGGLYASTHMPEHAVRRRDRHQGRVKEYRQEMLSGAIDGELLYEIGLLVPDTNVVNINKLLKLPVNKDGPFIVLSHRAEDNSLYIFEVCEATKDTEQPPRKPLPLGMGISA